MLSYIFIMVKRSITQFGINSSQYWWVKVKINKNFKHKIENIFIIHLVLTFVLGAHKNHLNDTLLLSTNNICFVWEIKKNIYAFL